VTGWEADLVASTDASRTGRNFVELPRLEDTVRTVMTDAALG
jgi:hypothetical protein